MSAGRIVSAEEAGGLLRDHRTNPRSSGLTRSDLEAAAPALAYTVQVRDGQVDALLALCERSIKPGTHPTMIDVRDIWEALGVPRELTE